MWESDDTLGDTIGPDYDILVARSIDDGVNWSAPMALNTNAASDSGTDSFPHVATDGAGRWVAVWMSTDALGGPPGGDFDILTARSVNGGVTWSTPVRIAGADAGPGFDGSPVVAVDTAGNTSPVWTMVPGTPEEQPGGRATGCQLGRNLGAGWLGVGFGLASLALALVVAHRRRGRRGRGGGLA